MSEQDDKHQHKKQPKHPAKDIILALRKIMQYLDLHSKKITKLYGLTIPQIVCLYEIDEHGPISISKLSKNIYLSNSTIVGIIDRLEEKKFVTRTRDAKDRRIIYLSVTSKAEEFFSTSPELLHNKLKGFINNISASEQLMLTNSIELVLNMLAHIAK